MSKETIVVSGFPGVGKSYLFDKGFDALDSDSSQFSWLEDGEGNKERHPDFPNNYIQHIQSKLGEVKYIFVSSHDVVRDALHENGIKYVQVFPDKALKHEYILRYEMRGSPRGFIDLMDKQFDNFVDGIEDDINDKKVKITMSNTFMSDVLNEVNFEYNK